MSYIVKELEPTPLYEPWFSTLVETNRSIRIAGWLKKRNMRRCRNPMRDFDRTFFVGSQANYDEDATTFYWGNILEIDVDGVVIEGMRGAGPIRIDRDRFVELNYEY